MPQHIADEQSPELLQVSNLCIGFKENGKDVEVVHDISFSLKRGMLTAIVGESGSGKSVTALSLLRLLPPQTNISGTAIFKQPATTALNLLNCPGAEMQNLRGNSIAMIFQEPMTSLNPVMRCGQQVMESLVLHKKMNRKQAKEKTLQLFADVQLANPTAILKRYPHEISGGQKQRVMIAMAMACDPLLLIADEPTTALDVRVQKSIVELLKALQKSHDLAVLFITHDLALVKAFADEVIVMQKGVIVEKGKTASVIDHPVHPYTRALLACRPTIQSKGKRLRIVDDFLVENKAVEDLLPAATIQMDEPVLEVRHLVVQYAVAKNIFGKTTAWSRAVDDVSFTVFQGETLGLVGESGCGKTTLGRAILQLVEPTAGKIILDGKEIQNLSPAAMSKVRKDLQIVFQDPYGSLNPRLSIGEAILEPLKVHGIGSNKKERREIVADLLQQVNMTAEAYNRYPHQFSGGQRQRICIARALALKPSFLIFDESVSALDVSVQAQVLNLINTLKSQYHFTAIFISHDLSVVHYISDRILVMHKGKIVETGTADEIMHHPRQDYTRQLIAAIP